MSSDEEDSDLSIIPYDDSVAAISYQAALRLVMGGDEDIQPASHHALSLAYDALKKRYVVLQQELRGVLNRKFRGKNSNNAKNGLRPVLESSNTTTVLPNSKSVNSNSNSSMNGNVTSRNNNNSAMATKTNVSAVSNTVAKCSNCSATIIKPQSADVVPAPIISVNAPISNDISATATRVLVTQQTLEKNKETFMREFDEMRRRNKELEHENQWLTLENARLQRELEKSSIVERGTSQLSEGSCREVNSDSINLNVERGYADVLNNDIGSLLQVVRGLKLAALKQNTALLAIASNRSAQPTGLVRASAGIRAEPSVNLAQHSVDRSGETQIQISVDRKALAVHSQCSDNFDHPSEDRINVYGRDAGEIAASPCLEDTIKREEWKREEEQVEACIDIHDDASIEQRMTSLRDAAHLATLTLDQAGSADCLSSANYVTMEDHWSGSGSVGHGSSCEKSVHGRLSDGVDDDEGFRSLVCGRGTVSDAVVTTPANCLLLDTTCQMDGAANVRIPWNQYSSNRDVLSASCTDTVALFRKRGQSSDNDSAFQNGVSSLAAEVGAVSRSRSEGHAERATTSEVQMPVSTRILLPDNDNEQVVSDDVTLPPPYHNNQTPTNDCILVPADNNLTSSSCSSQLKHVCPVCLSTFLLLSHGDFEQHVNNCIDRKLAAECEDGGREPLTLTSNATNITNNYERDNGSNVDSRMRDSTRSAVDDLECEQCGGVFSTVQQLVQHSQSHSHQHSMHSSGARQLSSVSAYRAAGEGVEQLPNVCQRMCPVCFKIFDSSVPQSKVNNHVNLHFAGDDFEYVEVVQP